MPIAQEQLSSLKRGERLREKVQNNNVRSAFTYFYWLFAESVDHKNYSRGRFSVCNDFVWTIGLGWCKRYLSLFCQILVESLDIEKERERNGKLEVGGNIPSVIHFNPELKY